MSVNHRIEYVPLTKDLNGNQLLYPIYIPINVDEPEVLMATGRLSKHDYKRTLKMLHAKPFMVSAGNKVEVKQAGFPIAPIIAALAPIVIPAAVKTFKSIFKKNKSAGEDVNVDTDIADDTYVDTDVDEHSSEVELPEDDISNDTYVDEDIPIEDTNEPIEDRLNEPIEDRLNEIVETIDNSLNSDVQSEASSGRRRAGYIPTNPNIRSLKQLQTLYNKH